MSERPDKIASNFIWNGTYLSWDQACEAAKVIGTGSGPSSDRWFKRITQQLLDYRDEFGEYGVAMPPRPSNLPLVCAMTKPYAIIDFGGSSGWCWDYLHNSVSSHRIESYVVIETEEVVNYMCESGLHNMRVKYKTINDSIKACDLLYCNSVLQYFASNATLISLINRTNPKYILLEDLVANGDDDFYTVQTYYEFGMPYRFIGLTNLLNELKEQGYAQLSSHPYASPILGAIKPFNMGNFPTDKQIHYSLSILLKRQEFNESF
ncbi:Putative methyltransferase, LIC12133 family [Methylophilaceae bacterium]